MLAFAQTANIRIAESVHLQRMTAGFIDPCGGMFTGQGEDALAGLEILHRVLGPV